MKCMYCMGNIHSGLGLEFGFELEFALGLELDFGLGLGFDVDRDLSIERRRCIISLRMGVCPRSGRVGASLPYRYK